MIIAIRTDQVLHHTSMSNKKYLSENDGLKVTNKSFTEAC